MNEILFKFINPVNEQLIKLFFDRMKKNLIYIALFVSSIMFVLTIVMHFCSNILFYIFSTITILLILLLFVVLILQKNNYQNTIKSISSNAKQEISVFEDHMFVHLMNGSSEGTDNIEWNAFKTYDDYQNVIIMNLDNKIFIIDKNQLTKEQIDFFYKKAVKYSRIINNKKNKRREQCLK